LACLTGCQETKHVTGPEFRREYDLRNAQTMVSAEYLGEKDGKVYLKRRTMSLVAQSKWNEEIWFTETNHLEAAFLARLKSPGRAATPATVTVILFDSADAAHPSPRDQRWRVTNAVQAAAIAGHIQSARVSPPNGPPVPACAIVGCVELVDAGGTTTRTYIRHVHFPTAVLLFRDDKNLTASNGVAFLADLARAGVPTNQLWAAEATKE
jgi:hypothetical protein